MNQKQQKAVNAAVDGLKVSYPDLIVFDTQVTEEGLVITHSHGETHIRPSRKVDKQAEKDRHAAWQDKLERGFV